MDGISHVTALTTQPGPGGLSDMALPNCPPGLEHLAAMEGLFVKQLLEPVEVFAGLETSNRYEVMDTIGRRIFFAAEMTNQCCVFCGGRGRPFTIRLLNAVGAPILTIQRKCSCCLFCCGLTMCGGNKVSVKHIGGEVIGTAKQKWSCCRPHFELKNENEELEFVIRGPACADCCGCCIMGACCTADFKVYLPDQDTPAGVIRKQADLRELVSDANTFGVTFAVKLDPRQKALILAAVFVIDFGYFESSAKKDKPQQPAAF